MRNNQARINKVGSSDNPPSEETPLGTLIEEEPKWECCCCDQAIPRPGGGYSTAVGSFCSHCFLEFLKYLFNGTPSRFLNEIRQESGRFIHERRQSIGDGALKVPVPVPSSTTVRDVLSAQRSRFKARLLDVVRELDKEEE